MGQAFNKLKKGDEKNDGDQSKTSSLPKSVKSLIDFVERNYDKYAQNMGNLEDFYHAIYTMIQKYSEESGGIQLALPTTKIIEEAYKRHRGNSTTVMSKEDCKNIICDIVSSENLVVGQKAAEVLAFIYCAPICAFLVKRFIPGVKSISDDIVIPAATTGAVLLLCQANKL